MRHQQRQQAALYERPIARLTNLLYAVHRRSDMRQMVEADWLMFGEQDQTPGLRREVVAAMLSLKADRKLPELLLPAWGAVISGADDAGQPPECRALLSDCGGLWIVAPRWEGANIRGGLVGCHGLQGGAVVVRDLDRPLLRWTVQVPPRRLAGWLEGDLLLAAT